MALSIDYSTKVITVPKADLTLIQAVPTEIRQLDLDSFRLELRDIEDSQEGIPQLVTHTHNTEVTVGGVTLARVISMINGYTVTFEDGTYAVNLVGANSNIGDVVNVNQVSIRSANSAGLVSLDILVAGAYGGKVVVSPTNGQAGTDTPIGTFETPVNNVSDAILIAQKQGVVDLLFTQNMTIADDLSGGGSGQPLNISGTSPFNVITIDPSAVVTGSGIRGVTVTGEVDGLNTVRECNLMAVTNLSGFVFQCSLAGNVTTNGSASFMQCFSGISGAGSPQIDVGAGNLIVRDYSGSIIIGSVTQGDHSIGVYGGRVTINASCTAGTIRVRGDAYTIIDNSAGATVIDERNITPKKIWDEVL